MSKSDVYLVNLNTKAAALGAAARAELTAAAYHLLSESHLLA